MQLCDRVAEGHPQSRIATVRNWEWVMRRGDGRADHVMVGGASIVGAEEDGGEDGRADAAIIAEGCGRIRRLWRRVGIIRGCRHQAVEHGLGKCAGVAAESTIEDVGPERNRMSARGCGKIRKSSGMDRSLLTEKVCSILLRKELY
jgi:hypothetical protein